MWVPEYVRSRLRGIWTRLNTKHKGAKGKTLKTEQVRRPKGVNDILPEEITLWEHVEQTARKIFSLYGYSEVRFPIFESSELFSRGIGEGTDVVEKEMYTFKDRGKRSFTLRPEGTASAVRLFVENKLYSSNSTTKIFYMGPMFRAERPQAGRYRQFHQIGTEIFGADSPWIDAESIHMLDEFFKTLGIDDNRLEINSVGCVKCRPKHKEKLLSFLIGNKEKLCSECSIRMEKNPLRAFDCKNSNCKSVMLEAPLLPEHICSECREHFEITTEALGYYGVNYRKNPHLVRGLDYYTRTAFELVNSSLGSQDAVAGGGRYDGLVKLLGGPDIKGFGFALGVERLNMILKAKNILPSVSKTSVYVAVLSEEVLPTAVKISQQIRSLGIIVTLPHEIKTLKTHLKKANKANATFTVLLGEDELRKNSIVLRDMKNSSQDEVCIDGIKTYLEGLKQSV